MDASHLRAHLLCILWFRRRGNATLQARILGCRSSVRCVSTSDASLQSPEIYTPALVRSLFFFAFRLHADVLVLSSLKMPSALEKGESVSMTPLPSPPPAYGASKATLTSTSSFSSTAPLALHFSYTLPSSPSLPAIPRVSRDSYQPGTAREVISVSEYSHADLSSAGFYPCPESPSSSSPFGLSTPMTATSSMPFTPTTPSSFDFPTTPSSMGASEWGSERTRVERDSTSTTDYVGPRVL